MQLAPELVYPLYLAAASDRYLSNCMLNLKKCILLALYMSHLFCCLIICSSQEPVVKRGEELLKRQAAGVNLDDSDLINRLFMLFNGMLWHCLIISSIYIFCLTVIQ